MYTVCLSAFLTLCGCPSFPNWLDNTELCTNNSLIPRLSPRPTKNEGKAWYVYTHVWHQGRLQVVTHTALLSLVFHSSGESVHEATQTHYSQQRAIIYTVIHANFGNPWSPTIHVCTCICRSHTCRSHTCMYVHMHKLALKQILLSLAKYLGSLRSEYQILVSSARICACDKHTYRHIHTLWKNGYQCGKLVEYSDCTADSSVCNYKQMLGYGSVCLQH